MMPSNKDYSNMTLEELVSKEKEIKSRKTITAVFIGALVGVAVWSATHKGFVLPIILLIVAFWIGSSESQKLKNIQAEISRRQ